MDGAEALSLDGFMQGDSAEGSTAAAKSPGD